jgi:hypothetical protein
MRCGLPGKTTGLLADADPERDHRTMQGENPAAFGSV